MRRRICSLTGDIVYRNKVWFLLIALIVTTSMAVPAGASALLFTDRATWEAATTGIFTLDFEGTARPGAPVNYSAAGYTAGGVQIIGLTPPDSYYLYDSADHDWGSGDLLLGPYSGWGGGYIQANFTAGGVTSVGSDIMTHTPEAASFVISLSTGETFTVATSSKPSRAFVGFTSDVPITSIQFTPSSGWPMIDNFSYGLSSGPPDPPPGETPEADTIIFGGTGLLGLWLARRMRKWAA
jgi:hypothetical protein